MGTQLSCYPFSCLHQLDAGRDACRSVTQLDVIKAPQTMKNSASAAAAQPDNDFLSTRFKWTIESFSKLKSEKHYSDVFSVGGYRWRVLIFPNGNNVDHLSVYLDVADSAFLPYGWSRYAKFSIAVIDQLDSNFNVREDTEHEFNKGEEDWGFTSFLPLSELHAPGRGYLLNDACLVEADVAVHRVLDWRHDSKRESSLCTTIKVARDEDLNQIGKDFYFDLVDFDKVRSFLVQKKMPFRNFKEEVAKAFGISAQCQRFWLWAKRQNNTYRPHRPLTHEEEMQAVEQLQEVSKNANFAELNLFLEVELGQDLRPMPPPRKSKGDILLFFKLYDPLEEEFRYVGRLLVKRSGKPLDILTKLVKMAGFSSGEEIELYEEIRFEPHVMCEHLDKRTTFCTSLLEDGDIVLFQKSPLVGNTEKCRYPDVTSFLEYVHNRQMCSTKSPTQLEVGDGNRLTNTRSSIPLPTDLSTSTVATSVLTSLSLPFLKENSLSAAHVKIVDEIFRKHGDVVEKVQVPDPAFKTFFLERLSSAVELFRSQTATSITAEVLEKLKNMIQSLALQGVKVDWLESFYEKVVASNKYALGLIHMKQLEEQISTAVILLQDLKDQLVEVKDQLDEVEKEIGNQTGDSAKILDPL